MTRMMIAVLAALALPGAAAATSPPAGPGAKGPVKILRTRPLTLQVSGVQPGQRVIVRLAYAAGERRLALVVNAGGIVRVGVNAVSCAKPVVSVTVTTTSARHIGALRLPIPECASRE